MQLPAFEGIMSVVVTPFDKNGAIDFPALSRLLDHLVGNGIHWIVPGGTTGEYYAQTLDERRKVMEFVAAQVKGRARLSRRQQRPAGGDAAAGPTRRKPWLRGLDAGGTILLAAVDRRPGAAFPARGLADPASDHPL
jgi:hypothetical protein